MSRQYINDRYCVRCNRLEPTPYLRQHYQHLVPADKPGLKAVDVGCGNGRNTKFLQEKNIQVTPVDMAGGKLTNVQPIKLGLDALPCQSGSVDVFLANYIFMFLSPQEREQLIGEIHRCAGTQARIMVEFYPALDSFTKTEALMLGLQKQIFKQLGWQKVLYSKGRFIAERPV